MTAALGACGEPTEIVGTAEAPPGPRAPVTSSEQPRRPAVEGRARDSWAAGGSEANPSADDPYRGLGTWIDIYDEEAWAHPIATVRSMAAHGVGTIYLQTSNFSRGRPFVHPESLAAFLDAAHRRGLEVVAWYLPGFRDLSLDRYRIERAIRFRTAEGNAFDSFALDIESPEVRRPWVRTRRLLRLSEWLRRLVGETYRLARDRGVPAPSHRDGPAVLAALPVAPAG